MLIKKHPRAIATLAGVAMVLALPPFSLAPLAVVALALMLHLTYGAGVKHNFWLGLCFGFGYFALGLYWIALALLTDVVKFGWLLPFANILLPLYLALYGAVVFLLLARWRLTPVAHGVAFAALWVIAEWLRGIVLTGFPWNSIGYVWVDWLPVAQLAALGGIYSLSWLTCIAATGAWLLITQPRSLRPQALLMLGLLLLVAAAGQWRLSDSDTSALTTDTTLRLVQVNIPDNHYWRDADRALYFSEHLALTRLQGNDAAIDAVIWPETGAPYFLDNDAPRRQAIAAVAPPNGLVLTGAHRATTADGGFALYNSLAVIDTQARLVAAYDKSHLVPFGEYLPLRQFFKDVAKVTAGGVDFSAGAGVETVTVPGLPPFSPLICYEAIFSGAVVGAQRPAWLLNITNDAWYGYSLGPYQHYAMSRLRAIEEGLPLVRVALTGITAVVDAWGREVVATKLLTRTVVDATLPKAIAATPFARYGHIPILFFALLLLSIIGLNRKN